MYNDQISSCEKLPDKNGLVSIHDMTKINRFHKPINVSGFSPEIASEILIGETESNYGLKRQNGFRLSPTIHTVYHGNKSISFLTPEIWIFFL